MKVIVEVRNIFISTIPPSHFETYAMACLKSLVDPYPYKYEEVQRKRAAQLNIATPVSTEELTAIDKLLDDLIL